MRAFSSALLVLSLGLALACGGGTIAGVGGQELPAEWVEYGVDIGEGTVVIVNGSTTIVKYPADADNEEIVAGWRAPLDEQGFTEFYKRDSNGMYSFMLKSEDGKTASFNVLEVLGEKQLSAKLPE